MDEHSIDQVMTINEVADYLKMKVVTIYKHAQEGKIPAFKVGSKWRFKKETIDKRLAQMLNELESGDRYMKMPYRSRSQ